MKIADIRELTDKELTERIDAEKASLDQIKINHSVSPLDSPAEIKKKRREIARMLTVLSQRKLTK